MTDFEYGFWEKENAECVQKMNAELDTMHLVQLGMAVVCFCQLSFMVTRFPRQTWEAVYLPTAECALYAMAATGNGYLKMANGKLLPWARMASWLATCPIMFIQINTIAPITVYGISMNNIQIALAVVRIVNGITASTATDPILKWSFFFLGTFCLIIEYVTVFKIFSAGLLKFRKASKTSHVCGKVCERLQLLRGIFYFSWTLFPVVWLFSPQGMCLLGEDVVPILYLMGDLTCKNFFGVMWYDTTWNILGGKGWDPEKQPKDHIEMDLNATKSEKGAIQGMASTPSPDTESVCLSVVPPLHLSDMHPLHNSMQNAATLRPISRMTSAAGEEVVTINGRDYVVQEAGDSSLRRSSGGAAMLSARTASSNTPRTYREPVTDVRVVREQYPSQTPLNMVAGDNKLTSTMVWSPQTPRTPRVASRAGRTRSDLGLSHGLSPEQMNAHRTASSPFLQAERSVEAPERIGGEGLYFAQGAMEEDLGLQRAEEEEEELTPRSRVLLESRRAGLRTLVDKMYETP